MKMHSNYLLLTESNSQIPGGK